MLGRHVVARAKAYLLRGLRFWRTPPPVALLDQIADEAKRRHDPLARLGVLLVRRRAERQQYTERLGPVRAVSQQHSTAANVRQAQTRPQVSRPRERREARHRARSTSSGDSGDDGPEPPPRAVYAYGCLGPAERGEAA